MNRLCESEAGRKLTDFCDTLSRYNLRKDYDLTIGLYADDETETPEASHRFHGSSRHSLLKLLGLIGLVFVSIALIRGLCCRLSKL